jgi:1-deoxy-D-xylulose-5-phosphate reductoisomerase
MTEQRRVVLLGSTGSIGTQALDVVSGAAGRFRVTGLAAGGGNVELLAQQAVQLKVPVVGIGREDRAQELTERIAALVPDVDARPQVLAGEPGITAIAGLPTDVVLNAIAGSAGLRATLAALESGSSVALANKESLVAGGPLVTSRARPGQLRPVDSEHSALAQCLRGGRADEVRRLILTASGGPFRGRQRSELGDVTPAQALAHPTWDMGTLITTNSATLVNKGLEVIEAHLLFDIDYDGIDVVVHPQSLIHSMVEFTDGSTLAQLSPPDMRLTISLALGWPDRVPNAAPPMDWSSRQTWTFEPLDGVAFPAVALAAKAGRAGGCAPAVFNAANEELVAAFHDGEVGFLQIVDTVGVVVDEWLATHHSSLTTPGTVEDIESADSWARTRALQLARQGS